MRLITIIKSVKNIVLKPLMLGALLLLSLSSFAQGGAKASARMDATQIAVGDQARLFMEVQVDPSAGKLQWATLPDTFNTLEIVERGKIDTSRQGNMVVYKQRLLITGFDSGMFKIPAFVFSVIPTSGAAFTVQTDSFNLLVQTIAVDTTKGFKGIKGIMYVKGSWRDYIPYIVGGIVLIALIIVLIIYLVRRQKNKPLPVIPSESLQDKTLRQLNALDAKQLWQKNQVKLYYIELSELVRTYIEARFNTPALELTTDELLYKARMHRELQPYQSILSDILNIADLAKFAKFQALPQEHMDSMQKAKEFVATSRPKAVVAETTDATQPTTGNTNNPTT